MPKTIKDGIRSIERHGVCLVFPIDNAKAPASLWYDFYPTSKMRWEWDADGDMRVADLWHLRTELSCSKKVVYAKWFRGRATFFSLQMATRFIAALNFSSVVGPRLSPATKGLLSILEESSPLSTKDLKKRSELGKQYDKAIKPLWERLQIVGFGEVEDGAFPSLAVGSTDNLFEGLWRDAQKLDVDENEEVLEIWGQTNPLFYKFFTRLRKDWQAEEKEALPAKKIFVWPGVLK